MIRASAQYLVPLAHGQRTDQQFVGQRDRLEQRRVHPPLKIGIVRGVRGILSLARVHAVVNQVDAGRGGDHPFGAAERERQHRADGRMQPAQAGPQAAAKPAVAVYAGGHARMRELEQDGTSPSGHRDHLTVDLPGHAAGAGPLGAGAEQPLPHGSPMMLEWMHASTLSITTSGVDVPAVRPTTWTPSNHSGRTSASVCT